MSKVNASKDMNEREELIKDLRHFEAAFRAEGKEIEADLMKEAADALCGPDGEAVALLREIDATGLLFRHNVELDAKVANFLSPPSATSETP